MRNSLKSLIALPAFLVFAVADPSYAALDAARAASENFSVVHDIGAVSVEPGPGPMASDVLLKAALQTLIQEEPTLFDPLLGVFGGTAAEANFRVSLEQVVAKFRYQGTEWHGSFQLVLKEYSAEQAPVVRLRVSETYSLGTGEAMSENVTKCAFRTALAKAAQSLAAQVQGGAAGYTTFDDGRFHRVDGRWQYTRANGEKACKDLELKSDLLATLQTLHDRLGESFPGYLTVRNPKTGEAVAVGSR